MILEYSGRIFTDVLCDSSIPLSPFRQSCEPVSTVRFKSIRLALMFHITADIFLRYGSDCFHIIGMVPQLSFPQLVSYFQKTFKQFSAGNTLYSGICCTSSCRYSSISGSSIFLRYFTDHTI